MEINKEVVEILREFKIPKDKGLLTLLGIYYKLDIETIVDEETIQAINLTKIVVIDYDTKPKKITWNIPLFEGQNTAFGWVKEWIKPFGKLNPERMGSARDATTRMEDFFRKYPEYRMEDVIRARDAYLASVKSPQYLIKSHKFIFDGIGAMKKSELLAWCEKVKGQTGVVTQQKGRILK